jgi:S-adenosylmethionine synthetase
VTVVTDAGGADVVGALSGGGRSIVETFGTGKIEEGRFRDLVLEHFNLKPRGIIEMLDLLRPIYRNTAAYGHFGRDGDLPWEKTDKAEALKASAGIG